MDRTDFIKFEFRLHWEMRKSDSSYGDRLQRRIANIIKQSLELKK